MATIGPAGAQEPETPYLIVLGIGQDGGAPQAGDKSHPGWSDPDVHHYTSSLGIVDPQTSQRWMIIKRI